jgi:hypothetical protein
MSRAAVRDVDRLIRRCSANGARPKPQPGGGRNGVRSAWHGAGRHRAARWGVRRRVRAPRARDFVQTISRVKFAWEFVWTFSLAILTRPPILQSSLPFLFTKPSIVCILDALRPAWWTDQGSRGWGLPYPVVCNAVRDGRLLSKINEGEETSEAGSSQTRKPGFRHAELRLSAGKKPVALHDVPENKGS